MDKAMMCPVFKVNKRELELILACLTQANVYIPRAILPDRSRISQMIKVLADYLKKGEGGFDGLPQDWEKREPKE